MYNRIIQKRLETHFNKGKAIIILGPRQVGKTTLINSLLKDEKVLFLNGDDPSVRNILNGVNTEQLKDLIGKNEFVFVDEAQIIPNIGLTLKLITDQIKQVQLIVSGSSSLQLGNLLNESLTGRKREFKLYPISWSEYEEKHGVLKATQLLNNRLVYGFYPEVLNTEGEEDAKDALQELASSYLFKDILALSNIRKPQVLNKLVRALAFQVGAKVSYNELAQLCDVDKNTVSNYIDLLEQAFVIYRLGSYRGNLRNEIKTNQKIYFYDNGIRNAIIGNFNPLALRNDIGALWENFLAMERVKKQAYTRNFGANYFWRTKQQQEVDWVEENNGELIGFEFKWNPKAKVKIPKKFEETYNTTITTINRDNFRQFVQ